MTKTLKSVLFTFSLFLCGYLNAQIEVAHLKSKGFSATGFGTFLNLGVPILEGSSITAEAGLYYFKKNDNYVGLIPFLLGYRYTLDRSGTGLYVEPTAGYSIGGTDIQKSDETGYALPDPEGDGYLKQKAKGITGGIGAGYIFPGTVAFNIGLRYQHVFISGDPSMNMFSIRLSHPISFKRREY
jgi:outer membrane protein with beta-barrel domain